MAVLVHSITTNTNMSDLYLRTANMVFLYLRTTNMAVVPDSPLN